MSSNARLTLTVAEAADLLGISTASVYRLARAGRMPGAVRLGGRLLISKAALDRALGAAPEAPAHAAP